MWLTAPSTTPFESMRPAESTRAMGDAAKAPEPPADGGKVGGDFAWPALLRKVERLDPSYKT